MVVINKSDFPPLPSQKTGKKPRRIKASDSTRKNTLATLNELPEELILDILDHLPGIDLDSFQLPTLLSLSLTSRRLHRTVSDRIYATYDSYFCDSYLFLRTMITKPDLARSVRTAHFRYGKEAHLDRVRYIPNAQDKKILKQGMKMLDFPDWKTWATRCNTDNIEFDILHTAIMLHTPNLTELHVEDNWISPYQDPKWIELIKKASRGDTFGHTHNFSRLESVRVDAKIMVLHQLAPLFHVPSLRRLHLQDLREARLGRWPVPKLERAIPPGCTNIEELTLEECFINPDNLLALSKSMLGLKRFRYEIDPELQLPADTGSVLIDVLGLHAKTLEELHIRVMHVDPITEEDECVNALYMHGGLRPFVALRRLNCPLGSIVDMRPGAAADLTDELPPSLTNITIRVRACTKEHEHMKALEQLADCPNNSLRAIQLDVDIPATRFSYDWGLLVKLFSAAGVDFVVHQDPDDEGFSEDWEDESTDSEFSESSDEVDLYSDEDD
jgi:hypothetical protein